MRRIFCMFVIGLGIFLAAGQASWAAETYVNGIDANFPPFSFVNKSGEPDGFDVRAVDWIAKEMGFEVTHQPMDWDGIIPNLLAEKIDFIASGMSITPEREIKVDFTIPYWTITQVFVAQEGAGMTVEDVLHGEKTLGVQRGTSEAEWLKEQAEKKGWGFTLRYYDSAPMAVADVVNGRIDAAAMDDAPAADAVRKRPVEILGTFGMEPEEFGYAVREEDDQLLQTLNEGLRRLMNDPYWQELINKYNPGE
ncbi:ABC transporter substrate-binding protein [Desulfovermiculus halophilus]|uniref:ABC transporter substrate-binding protein n=1 Tax=Desulfovermiculus halophilus TaxID=339722 RepID=UPI000484D4E8